jgi:Cys-tRNA(Pro)/Cys-tRNA(Cys) deacylase
MNEFNRKPNIENRKSAMGLNSLRLLDARKIPYRTLNYDQSGEFHSATDAAQLIGALSETVFKTLVVLRDPPKSGKPLLLMVPAAQTVDLKVLAKSLGNAKSKLKMATQREAESMTGLKVGGISALALLNRGFEICLDESVSGLGEMHISAGQRGVDVCVAVKDLVSLTNARIVRTFENGKS